jgi:hypothetical protein
MSFAKQTFIKEALLYQLAITVPRRWLVSRLALSATSQILLPFGLTEARYRLDRAVADESTRRR